MSAGLAGSSGCARRRSVSARLGGSGQLTSGRGGGRGTDDEVRAEDFQEQARRGSTAQGRHARVDGFCQVRQLRAAEALGLDGEDLPTVSRRRDQPLLQGRRHRLDNHEIPQAVQQVDGKAARLVAGLNDIIDQPEQTSLVLIRQGLHGVVQQAQVSHAQQWTGNVVRQAIRAGTGQQLVQDGQGVTRRAAAGLNDHGVDRVIHVDVFRGHGALQQPLHGRRGQQAEGIVVGTRTNGADDLFRLRRGEDEDDVLRGLLHHLQQRVGAGGRDHVRLIDDEDAVARLRWGVIRAVPQLTHVLHAVVGGRVELSDVQIARPAGGQRHARIAHATRRGRGPLLAVERAGHDARRRGLSAAARAGKEVRMVNAPRVEGGGQRGGDLLLAYHFRERCWTIFPVKSHG